MRFSHHILCLTACLAVLFTGACQKQAPSADRHADIEAPSVPERLSDPQAIAELICRYSRGSFPNWTLWPDFIDYLPVGERGAVQYVSERLLSQIPERRRPKHLAVSRFIANHTSCALGIESGEPVIARDSTGAISFKFNQTFPAVPNVPPPYGLKEMSPKAQEAAWLRAFERESLNGESYTRSFSVTVAPDEDARYIVRTNILKSYAEPLRINQFWQSMYLWQFEKAFEQLTVMCVQEHPACEDLKAYYASTAAFRRDMSARFARDVSITDIRQKLVAPGAGGSYTVLEMTLTNHGSRDYTGLVFATDEAERQYCELQSERTRREDRPLTLRAGESRTAWCALSGDTKPWIEPEFWFSG